ncbi:MAG: hypothetical protein ACLSA6_13195 [Holdemania massiliensis]
MKFSIRHKIIFFFSLASLLVFSALGAYIGFSVRPRTMTQTRFAISQMVESKANEVSMWVKRMAVEYRTIAAIPAFSSMDVREITPLIDRFTELYKRTEKRWKPSPTSEKMGSAGLIPALWKI